jgi:hypothetical protein
MMGSAHQLLGEAGIVHPIRLAHVTFLDIAQRASKKLVENRGGTTDLPRAMRKTAFENHHI